MKPLWYRCGEKGKRREKEGTDWADRKEQYKKQKMLT